MWLMDREDVYRKAQWLADDLQVLVRLPETAAGSRKIINNAAGILWRLLKGMAVSRKRLADIVEILWAQQDIERQAGAKATLRRLQNAISNLADLRENKTP